jgi:hypothetical protein
VTVGFRAEVRGWLAAHVPAEHELSRWLVQVRALVPAWGGPAEHRARVLRELG